MMEMKKEIKNNTVHSVGHHQIYRLLSKAVPWFFLFSGYVTTLLFIKVRGFSLLNSDEAAEMIFGKFLSTRGGFLSKEWFYSTELKVINNQIIFKYAFRVFPDNWQAARLLAVGMLLGILLLSYFFMSWALKLKKGGVWSAAVLVWPFGQWYALNISYGTMYIPYISISFISLGLLFRCMTHLDRWKSEQKKSEAVRIAVCTSLLAFLALLAGMAGIRQLMCCYVPLLGVSVILLFLPAKKRDSGIWCAIQKKGDEFGIFCFTAVAFIFALIGYEINHTILSAVYSFKNESEHLWRRFSFHSLLEAFSDFTALFGWHTNVLIIHWQGIADGLAILLGLAVLFFLGRLLLHSDTLSQSQRVLVIFFTIALLLNGLVFASTDGYNASYWLPILPFAFPILQIGVEQERWICESRKYRIGIAACYITTVVLSSCNVISQPYIDNVANDQKLVKAGQWLAQSDYTQGIGTFWNSDVMTELTNGKVEMWTVDNLDTLSIYGWLQVKEHNTLPEGKIFLITTSDEFGGVSSSIPKMTQLSDHLVYQDTDCQIYGFDDVQQYQQLIAGVQ